VGQNGAANSYPFEWRRETWGTYTYQRCLLCTATPHGYGDSMVEGLALYAEPRTSYPCDAHGSTHRASWCSGVANDCYTNFPMAAIGHRGGGNQYCNRAAWIQ
jgi:hypothetical protein